MPTTADVEAALALSPQERGAALAAIREDQWFDRKSARISAQTLADSIVAMANAEGGSLVIGLRDGQVEGVDSVGERVNGWRQASVDFTDPPVPIRVVAVECVNASGLPDHVLVVDVHASDHVHSNKRDEVFLRLGDENRLLRFEQRRELVYDKGQASYEATPVQRFSVARLDEELLHEYAVATGHPDPKRLLVARGLLTQSKQVTVGACLLFAPEPQAFYPAAHIRVLRFRGTERGTGARQQLVHDERFDGPIPRILDSSREAISALVPGRRALGRSARFEKMPFIPLEAWFEGVVNAVVHRSYSMAGDHIRVEIFDDRIEIESPGRFPGVVDGSDPLSIARFARNPRIARACAELHFGQELGEGIRRMYEEMRLAGLSDPVYRQTSGSVVLVLRAGRIDQDVRERVSSRGAELLEILGGVGPFGFGTGDLVRMTRWSRPTVLRELRALVAEGLVERHGGAPNDPWASWHRSNEL